MAAVLHFEVDAIVYTGGMAYERFFCDDITKYVGKIAPVLRLPGEEEMRSLAEGPCGCSTESRRPAYIELFFQSKRKMTIVNEKGGNEL